MLAGKMTAAQRADLRARKAEKPVDPRVTQRARDAQHTKQLIALNAALDEARQALQSAIIFATRIKPHCTHIEAVRHSVLVRQVCLNGLEQSKPELVE